MPAIRRTGLNLITLFSICGILILGMIFTPKPCPGQEPRATPYRPTLSNPAQVPVPGCGEMEMGWQSLKEKATDHYLHTVPYLFKLAFSDCVGLLIGGEALIVKDFDQGSTLVGLGDLTPLFKFKVPSSSQSASAFGLEVGARLPTAPETITRQQTDYLVAGIYSTEI